ncbi:MAG: hypothetical protein N3D82_02710 [Ignisphaera sp.]|nr:hypothetical protein [Ignisphaera sp.]MCX8167930.1 hypothetical protein [Ignisphaera sp.]MDW8086163.1 hypothetical protein [Ignisphaera sp.]
MKFSTARRAVSGILPGAIVAAAILLLALLSIHLLSSSMATFAHLVKTSRRPEQMVAIHSVAVYSNGSVSISIANTGSSTVERVSQLDLIVSYTNPSGQHASYLLRFSQQPLPGCWWIEEICVEGTSTCFSRHPYPFLRPGEEALVRGFLLNQPAFGSWGYIVVVTPTGYKAEKAFAVVG